MKNGALKFNFSMPVWGTRYVDVLLNGGLPSVLAPGNLANFAWREHSIFEFYTTKEEAKLIAGTEPFHRIERLMEVRFVHLDEQLSNAKSKWTTFRYAQRESVKSADQREAALFFLQPDQIWSDGSLTRAAERINDGFSAVMCPGLRTIEESILPDLRARYLSEDGCSLTVPSRDLVRAAVKHLHPEMYGWIWRSPTYWTCPTYILFPVKKEGFLAHCYILHPVVINAQVRNAPFRHIFDQDYLEAACPDFDKIYIARSSDDIIHFEVSPRDSEIPGKPAPHMHPITAMTWWGEYQYNLHHRRFGKLPVAITSGDTDNHAWRMAKLRGRVVVWLIGLGWKIPDIALLLWRPSSLVRRLEARYRWNPDEISRRDSRLLAFSRILSVISIKRVAQFLNGRSVLSVADVYRRARSVSRPGHAADSTAAVVGTSSTRSGPRRFHFAVPVWGENYVSLFLSHVLPSHLAPGNLPSIPANEVCYRIIADRDGAERIRQSDIFKKLTACAGEIVFDPMEQFRRVRLRNASPVSYTYARMTQCHKLALSRADAEDSATIFLNADTVYSDGAFSKVYRLGRQGIRLVEIVSLRTRKETISDLLTPYIIAGGDLRIAPRELIKLALGNLHEISSSHFWDGPPGAMIPDNLYWWVGEDAVVAHCTHFHPVMMFPRKKFCDFQNSIDHDLIENIGLYEQEVYLVKDSEEFAAIEISDAQHSQFMSHYERGSIPDVARFLKQLCRPIHVNNLQKAVRLYAVSPEPAIWMEVESRAKQIVDQLIQAASAQHHTSR